MKRFLSVTLCIVLLCGIFSIPTYAASFDAADNKYMLMDFSHGMPEGVYIKHNGSYVAKTDAVYITSDGDCVKSGSETALVIDYSETIDDIQIELNLENAGLNQNFAGLFPSYYNKRFKLNDYNIYIDYKISDGTSGLLTYHYTKYDTNINSGGANFTAFDGDTTTQDYDKIHTQHRAKTGDSDTDTMFNTYHDTPVFEGIVLVPNNQENNSGKLYIDSIYLVPVTDEVLLQNQKSDDTRRQIINFEKYDSGFSVTTTSDEHTRLFGKTLKVDVSDTNGSATRSSGRSKGLPLFMYSDDECTKRNYDYINAWVYFGSAGDGVRLWLRPTNQSSVYLKTPEQTSTIAGWKLISTSLDSLTGGSGTLFYAGSQDTSSNYTYEDYLRSIYVYPGENNTSAIYCDNIWLSKNNPAQSPFELVENNTPRYIDDPIEIEFTNPISPAYSTLEGAVTVTADSSNNEITGFITTIKDNKLLLDFSSATPALVKGETYTANISNKILDYDGKSVLTDATNFTEAENPGTKPYTFTIESDTDLRVKGIKLTNGYTEISSLPKAGKIEVTADVTSETGTAVLMLAIYSNNGEELDKVITSDRFNLADGPANIKVGAEQSFVGKTVKAFIWNDTTGNITPLNINLAK